MIARGGTLKAASSGGQPGPWPREAPMAAAALLAGLAMLGWKRRSWPVVMVLMLAGLGGLVGLSGCGGTSGSGTSGGGVPAGSYTITLTGTDSATSSLTASTTFTVTVQ